MIKDIKNEQGVTVFIAMLILSLVVFLTFSVSDIVIRTSQLTKKTGFSEKAYYAAQAGVEEALYQIENERSVEELDETAEQLSYTTDASWQLAVSELSLVSTDCQDLGSSQGVCSDSLTNIVSSNPLEINLDAGSSFQLELDFTGLDYPDSLQISISPGAVLNMVSISSEGVIEGYSDSFTLSSLSSNLYKLRITNIDSSGTSLVLTPSTSGTEVPLPLGIILQSEGSFKDSTRILKTTRKNWQIY